MSWTPCLLSRTNGITLYIGLQLNILHPILDAIEGERKDNRERLMQMLKHWPADTSSPAAWSGLVQALMSVSVGEKELAENIRKMHCSQNEEETTGTAPSERRERKRTPWVKEKYNVNALVDVHRGLEVSPSSNAGFTL